MPRRVTNRAISASVVLSALMLAAGLAGCGKTQTSASLLADAQKYQQKGDTRAALIQLKNAASQSPEDAAIRLQLATLYNETADPVSAEKEIRKAASLGMDAARVAPQLAKALFAQGQPQKAIDETAPAVAKAGPELLATRGDAYFALNDKQKAKASYQQALVAKPGFSAALMGLARLAFADGDLDGAGRYAEQASNANPKDALAWTFKGSVLAMLNKKTEALAAFDQAIALKPDLTNALVERATIEIGLKKFDAAKADLAAARKSAPKALAPVYTQALLDFTQGNSAAANESIQKVLTAAPDYMPSILLAGAIDLSLGSLKQAEKHLQRYLEKYPENDEARKLLAQAQLRGAQPGDAAATLAPGLKKDTKDAQMLALAGESALRAHDFSKATQYFEQAAALAPDTAKLHTSLGLSRLAQGDTVKGIGELERATALDPKSEDAGVALVKTELSLKHYDKAVAAVKALVAAHPDRATVRTLEGRVYQEKGDRAAARASYEKAASLQADLFAPVMNLAKMDLDDKKADAAKQRLLAFADTNKKDANAMAALASLAISQQRMDEATVWLEKASAENPDAVGPGKLLANHYLQTNQPAKALTLVRKLHTANQTNPELLELLGQAQLVNNDPAGALETYSKLVNVTPKSAAAQLRLASAHVKMKNETAAAEDLKKAVALDPNFIPARLAQIELAMGKGNADQALATARQVQRIQPKVPLGYVIEGDILMSQKKPDLAARAYEQGFAVTRSPQVLVKLADALKAAGKTREADAKIAEWQKTNPSSPIVSLSVGQAYLEKRQFKEAIEQFETILKGAPNNPLVLNNLALAYQEQNDPRALETAERAVRFAPNNPAILDTLGWMLVQHGNVSRGLSLLQQAVAIAPNAPESRYHLAFALNKSGDKKTARQELDKLLSNNKHFPQIDEARALLKTL